MSWLRICEDDVWTPKLQKMADAMSKRAQKSVETIEAANISEEDICRLLHTLWTKAVGSFGYDKDEWIKLELYLRTLKK